MRSEERKDVKAWYNWRSYWSSRGKARAMMRNKWDANAKEEEFRQNNKWKTYEQTQKERGLTKVGNTWTAGDVKYCDSTYPCRVCGGVMNEDHRVEYSSGAVYVTYKCGKCHKELPVKIK